MQRASRHVKRRSRSLTSRGRQVTTTTRRHRTRQNGPRRQTRQQQAPARRARGARGTVARSVGLRTGAAAMETSKKASRDVQNAFLIATARSWSRGRGVWASHGTTTPRPGPADVSPVRTHGLRRVRLGPDRLPSPRRVSSGACVPPVSPFSSRTRGRPRRSLSVSCFTPRRRKLCFGWNRSRVSSDGFRVSGPV